MKAVNWPVNVNTECMGPFQKGKWAYALLQHTLSSARVVPCATPCSRLVSCAQTGTSNIPLLSAMTCSTRSGLNSYAKGISRPNTVAMTLALENTPCGKQRKTFYHAILCYSVFITQCLPHCRRSSNIFLVINKKNIINRKTNKQDNKKHTAVVIDRKWGSLQTVKLDYQTTPNNNIFSVV